MTTKTKILIATMCTAVLYAICTQATSTIEAFKIAAFPLILFSAGYFAGATDVYNEYDNGKK